VRPKPTIILLGELLAGTTDGLAGESSADEINWLKFLSRQFCDIAVLRNVGPMFM
jgi:hypothetical protein